MNKDVRGHSDINQRFVLYAILPRWTHPYISLARLDRPVGIWLLLLPSIWGIVLASSGWSSFDTHIFRVIILFAVGAVVMRAAGCVINDILDRDLDAHVKRTSQRPIASGAVSVWAAIVYLLMLLGLGFLVLIQFNVTTIMLGFVTLPLIATYPLMKRVTWWPQAFLGVVFNFGALMGWTAIHGSLAFEIVLLYIGCIFWTLGYDTIYAHQDLEDDAMAGIKSTARRFGSQSRQWVAGFYMVSALLFGIAAYNILGIYGLIAGVVMGIHFARQIYKWDASNAKSSLNIFKSNIVAGFLFMIFLI